MRRNSSLRINVLTIFPEMINSFLEYSIIQKAIQRGIFKPNVINLRDFTTDRHHTVDDKPYGGGSGMVMKIEPIARALSSLRKKKMLGRVYMLCPSGRRYDQSYAKKLAKIKTFTLICGRYEGIDERVADKLCDGAISLGDFILNGGEIAAEAIIESSVRLMPDVLGAADSALNDSFSDGLLDYPHYTRPIRFRSWQVPEELMSGNHALVNAWRRKQQIARTYLKRPDLIESAVLSETDLALLETVKQHVRRRKFK